MIGVRLSRASYRSRRLEAVLLPAEFTVAPGRVSLTVENLATRLTHSLDYPPGTSPADVIESVPVVALSESDTIEFTINSPVEYAFICSFHESLGQTGVMSVEE